MKRVLMHPVCVSKALVCKTNFGLCKLKRNLFHCTLTTSKIFHRYSICLSQFHGNVHRAFGDVYIIKMQHREYFDLMQQCSHKKWYLGFQSTMCVLNGTLEQEDTKYIWSMWKKCLLIEGKCKRNIGNMWLTRLKGQKWCTQPGGTTHSRSQVCFH